MSRRTKPCKCGTLILDRETQCCHCEQEDEQAAFEARTDVIMLTSVDTLDDLKNWIKEYLIK
jgi:hypothetical protein